MEKKEPYFNTIQPAYVAGQSNYGTAPPSYDFQPQQPAYGGQAPYYGGAQPGYVQSQSPPPPPPAAPMNVPPQSIGWWQRASMNKPQSNSVGAAALIFMSGGMNMTWGFQYLISTHLRISWFIAAIIGAILGSVVVNSVQKKLIYFCASSLVLLSGVLFVSLPNNYEAIMAGRYINGIAVGLSFTTCIVMSGEELVKSLRGRMAASTEAMSFSLGIYIELIYSYSWTNSNPQLVNGALCILYGALALLITFLLVVESPVFFLVRNDETSAIDSLRRLQRPYIVTQQTYDQLDDHKRYIAFNRELTIADSVFAGLPALLKLCLYRALVALTFTLLVSYAFSYSYGHREFWPNFIFGTLRWLGVLISSLTLDTVGRKKTMLFGGLICAGMAIGLGVVFTNFGHYLYIKDDPAAMSLLFIFQFFSGIFISASSAYLSEAFPLAIKPYYITAAFVTEMLVHIIICCVDLGRSSISDYFYAVGALFFIFIVLGVTTIPETMQTSLLEAQQKFSQRVKCGFN